MNRPKEDSKEKGGGEEEGKIEELNQVVSLRN
jgi:hypothetical protein